MTARTCPRCGFLHPGSATRCECGHAFEVGSGSARAADRGGEVTSWDEEPLLALVAMIFCWPLGLILLWQNKQFSQTTKLAITGVWFVLFCVYFFYAATRSRNAVEP